MFRKMEDILKNLSSIDILTLGFFFGMVFIMLQDVVISLTDYLREKSWSVSDYERIISTYVNLNDVLIFKDKCVVIQARKNFIDREMRKHKFDKLINKFKRKG